MKRLTILLLFIPAIAFSSIKNAKSELSEGNPEKAIQQLLSLPKTADVLKELGVAYFHIRDFDAARNYFTQLKQKAEAENNKLMLAKAYNNLGIVELEVGQLENAIYLFQKSLNIKKTLPGDTRIESSYSNIGLCYQKLGDFKESLKYCKKALAMAKLRKDSVTFLINIGRSYLMMNTDSAFYFQTIASKLAENEYDKQLVVLNYAEYFSETGQHKKSLEYLCKYILLQEKLYDTDLINKVKEIEKKHREIIAEKEQEHKETVAWITGSFGGGFALIILFAAFNKLNEFRKKLPTLNLVEKLQHYLPEGSNFYYDAYKKPLPEPIETKVLEIIKLIIKEADSKEIFLNLLSDGNSFEITLNIQKVELTDLEMVKPVLLANESKIKIKYQIQKSSLNCFLSWG